MRRPKISLSSSPLGSSYTGKSIYSGSVDLTSEKFSRTIMTTASFDLLQAKFVYMTIQGSDDTTLLGGELPRLKSMSREDGSPTHSHAIESTALHP